MINNNKEICARIRMRRKELKLTADEIARSTGLSRSTISRYESGEIKQIKLAVIESLADALRVNPDWLIGKSDYKERRSMNLIGADRYDMEKVLTILIDWMADPQSDVSWKGKPMDVGQKVLVMSGLQSVKKMFERSNE